MPIELVPYDPRWPAEFEAAAAQIRAVTGRTWLVEHIGSTSVPGLSAKPVIDLAVRVPDLQDVDAHQHDLVGIGFLAIAGGPLTHKVRVRVKDEQRTHIAHFFPPDQWAHCNQRIFRDWLIEHPEDRDRYEQAKRTAAGEAAGGRDYTQRKTAVVQEIVDRARAALGLPRVDVWDK
ncbi:MAG TPA: GrpB family protein [Mycobacteriales bacterium]|nr:GrpB family protein [Mycobacteriales bacterium]